MKREYHFIKEIREQPEGIRKTLEANDAALADLARASVGNVKRLILTGCGDPYMLGIGAAYAFEQWAKIPAESFEAAEFSMYRHNLVDGGTLVALITSSGKTVKVIDAARLSAQRGAPTFALTNLNPSPITEETDTVIQTQAGWSDSFPTKQTTTASAALYALALHWAALAQTLPEEQVQALRKELYEDLPQKVEQALGLEADMQALAQKFVNAPIYAFIGSGPNYCTALLGAAKMKETSQSRSEACNLEEYAHLHTLSLRPGDPVFILTAPGSIGERNRLVSQHIHAQGGQVVVIGPPDERDKWHDTPADFYEVPAHDEMFGPIVAWIPLQLFAYHVAILKERNPDRPPVHGPMDYLQEIIYTSMLEGWEDR